MKNRTIIIGAVILTPVLAIGGLLLERQVQQSLGTYDIEGQAVQLAGLQSQRSTNGPTFTVVQFPAGDGAAYSVEDFPFAAACRAVMANPPSTAIVSIGPEIPTLTVVAFEQKRTALIFTSTKQANRTFEIEDGTCVINEQGNAS